MERLLATLLDATPATDEHASIRAWKSRFDAQTAWCATTIDRAFVGGFHADRVAFAFAAGYQCALHALDPALSDAQLGSFCATESKGAHPRFINTRLEERDGVWSLRGEKRWSTMAPDADVLLVVCSRGVRADGNNDLVLVRVSAKAPGVAIEAMPSTTFIPEIAHARIVFDAVPVSANDMLAGDGYTRYVKPFRTVEDAHVHAALLGHLVRVARTYAWPHEALEAALVLIAALRSFAASNLETASVHLGIAGVLSGTRAWIDANAPHWSRVDSVTRERWERDRALLLVADSARSQRTERAWMQLAGAGGKS